MSKKFRISKILMLSMALVFLLSAGMFGTMAWLADESDPVVNTFTYGDIDITLTETDTHDGDNDETTNSYKMMPGQTIEKDPVVTVGAGSEDMWLFVELEESANFADFMEYTVAEGWTALTGVADVYYCTVTAADVASADKAIPVLKDDTVTVKGTVTLDMLRALDADPTAPTYPTLTVTAYAVQYVGFATALDAWAQVTTPANP